MKRVTVEMDRERVRECGSESFEKWIICCECETASVCRHFYLFFSFFLLFCFNFLWSTKAARARSEWHEQYTKPRWERVHAHGNGLILLRLIKCNRDCWARNTTKASAISSGSQFLLFYVRKQRQQQSVCVSYCSLHRQTWMDIFRWKLLMEIAAAQLGLAWFGLTLRGHRNRWGWRMVNDAAISIFTTSTFRMLGRS